MGSFLSDLDSLSNENSGLTKNGRGYSKQKDSEIIELSKIIEDAVIQDAFRNFDPINDEEDQGLLESIQANGLYQPINVEVLSDNRAEGPYRMIAGHRRLAARRYLGYTDINAILNPEATTVEEQLNYAAMTIDENINRKDLTTLSLLHQFNAIFSLMMKAKKKIVIPELSKKHHINENKMRTISIILSQPQNCPKSIPFKNTLLKFVEKDPNMSLEVVYRIRSVFVTENSLTSEGITNKKQLQDCLAVLFSYSQSQIRNVKSTFSSIEHLPTSNRQTLYEFILGIEKELDEEETYSFEDTFDSFENDEDPNAGQKTQTTNTKNIIQNKSEKPIQKHSSNAEIEPIKLPNGEVLTGREAESFQKVYSDMQSLIFLILSEKVCSSFKESWELAHSIAEELRNNNFSLKGFLDLYNSNAQFFVNFNKNSNARKLYLKSIQKNL